MMSNNCITASSDSFNQLNSPAAQVTKSTMTWQIKLVIKSKKVRSAFILKNFK
ncbi:hypothetical protein [Flavobacterium sp. HJJ]|uniref:hypothetical protein n=1 Tax=Flavobacterium sp. HJJ TaxID=2783792 RepID=UPI00188BD9FE|nr:hypothetical protein [Flavobacterium sp. HJJ]MBF4471692.1 hypothetical protein [Flavobacterium sp. HJJ]